MNPGESATPWWKHYPWRLIQTNLREIDMVDIRADQVVRDLREFHATVLMLNAAGIIASYPTRLPFQCPSPFLQGASLLEIIDACHEADIRVIARTDFSKVRRPVFERHPEWAYRTVAGEIVDYNGDVHACPCGGYQQERAFDIMEEVLTTHPFDGIFFNMSGFVSRDYSGNNYGICHCESCRIAFLKRMGRGLPEAAHPTGDDQRAYQGFCCEVQRELESRVSEFLHRLNPQLCVANQRAAGRGFVRSEANTALDRPQPHWHLGPSAQVKSITGNHPGMVASNSTVDFIDFPYRHAAVSPHQQRLRLLQSLAHGGALDYYLIGRLDRHEDRSGFAAVREVFGFHAAHEGLLAETTSCADTLLLSGPNTDENEMRGWFRVLSENHVLFDSFAWWRTLEAGLAPYRLVIVPDMDEVPDSFAATLDAFACGGGTLLVVGRPGLSDEAGVPRARPALESVGIDRVHEVRRDVEASYVKIGNHAGFLRCSDTDLFCVHGLYVQSDYSAECRREMRWIPPHPYGPPERCYYEEVTDYPGYTVREFGRGRVLHVPWLPGSFYFRHGHPNTSWFMADLLEKEAGAQPLLCGFPTQVEVNLRRSGDTLLLHLLNLSGHFGASFLEPVPMRDLRIEFPCQREPRAVRLLQSGGEVRWEWKCGRLGLTLPQLGDFECIAVQGMNNEK